MPDYEIPVRIFQDRLVRVEDAPSAAEAKRRAQAGRFVFEGESPGVTFRFGTPSIVPDIDDE